MKKTSMFAALLLAGSLCGATLSVQAQQAEAEPKGGSLHPAEIKVGEKAPEEADRKSEAIDWKKAGLTEPEKESQWVKHEDQYLRVQITNGRITEIVPVKQTKK